MAEVWGVREYNPLAQYVLIKSHRDELSFGLIVCARWDGSALSINVTQVAMVSLLVSASVCQLVSLTGIYVCEAYTIWPWPCISPVSHTSVSRCLYVCVCQCVLSAQTPRFPGMLVEFRLFYQVTVVCALRGVSVNSHTGREINTLTLSHSYTNLITWHPTPCTVKNSLRLAV